MDKTASTPSHHALPVRSKPRGNGLGKKKERRPKENPDLDKTEQARTIDQVRGAVEHHRDCASEVRAKLEELTGTALSELSKVEELKGIILNLKQDGPGRKERWTQELDRELEKLRTIKKLLEASLPAAAEQAGPPAERPGPDGAKKILVIDDDLTTIKLISHFLQRENYQVSASQSGVEGLKKAFREVPDLILLDIMMPDLNGFQFLSIYRQVEENARTPVLILSSLAEEADILKGLEIGAVDYITKPFSPHLLMAKIKKSLRPGP
jgi:CheY-like chemotaxis protein